MKTVILLSLLWIQHDGEKGNDFDQSGTFSVTPWKRSKEVTAGQGHFIEG